VVANTGKILHTTTTDEHDAVLLEVVTFTGDVADDFHAVGETNTAHLTKSGVRLLRGRRVNAHAHATLLRAGLERRAVGASFLELAAVSDELLDCRHYSFVLRMGRVTPRSLTYEKVGIVVRRPEGSQEESRRKSAHPGIGETGG